MAKDTMAMDTLPRHVYDELREEFNMWFTEWREDNPDGDIIDWIVKTPKLIRDWSDDFDDTDPKTWWAWLDFCNWFTEQNRLVVAEAARKKAMAQMLKDFPRPSPSKLE